MTNIININSTNIGTFGFTSVFDLLAKTLTFDISNLTTFNGSGASAVVGIAFQVTDPSGLVIATIDWSAPQIDPATQTTFTADIVNGFAMFGWYNITGTIRDAGNNDYSINLIKEVCQPDGFVNNGYVPGVFNIIADCDTPKLNITELTRFSYKGRSATGITKAGILSYPPGTLSDLDFTFTPFAVGGSGLVYTGRYTLNNSSVANYDLQDGVSVNITYKVTGYEKVVNCTSSLETILCCYTDLTADYERDPYSSTGAAIKKKLDSCSTDLMLAIVKEKSGQDASEQAKKIANILGCDCNCSSNSIEPKIMVASSTINPFTLIQADAVNISSATVLGTKQYTIEVKNIFVTNLNNDLAININKVVSGTAITYGISFNYNQLATAILEEIQSDDTLTSLLQSLVGGSGSILSLAGLSGGCIITLTNCNYTLIEANNIPKTIVSIVIGGNVINAPSSLLLSNTTSVASWLNGLSLGTFTVTLDSATETINITSNTNPNAITIINFTTSNGPLIRQFTKACIGLVAFLNALVTYICDLQAVNIKLGVASQQYSIWAPSGVTVNNIATNATLDTVLTNILTSEASLFNALASLGLTCQNVRALFKTVNFAVIDTDGVLGTLSGNCAMVSYDQLAGILLAKISASATWQTNFCALVANCSAPQCPALTNPSASYSSGTLIVNANGATGSTPIQIKYRIFNSGSSFTIANTTAASLPLSISSLTDGVYEVQVAQQCSNSIWSPFVSVVSNNGCTNVVAFGVTISGSNFVIAGTLTSPQTKIQVQMTDPTGGVTTVLNDFGATSGTFNIPIPGAIYGNYTFIARAVCNASTVPIYASNYTAPVIVAYANPTANNIRASASYGMTFTDISNGSCSGIPAAFNGAVIPGNLSAYTPNITAGTISFTVTGTIPGAFPIYCRLVLNGVSIVAQTTITAAGTFTLTNPAFIDGSANSISIEIDH